jgi:hypothetical protein
MSPWLKNGDTISYTGNLSVTGKVNGVDKLNSRISRIGTESDREKSVSKWNIRITPNNSWWSICWSPELGLFVAVAISGAENRVMSSIDGVSWVNQSTPVDNNWRSVCWSPELGLFVAVANSGTNNRVMTSTDSITWLIGEAFIKNWSSVCWSPKLNLFVAVSNNTSGNTVMISSDGFDWTEIIINSPTYRWESVCWSPELELFVAVASLGPSPAVVDKIMISSDGSIWVNKISGTHQWRSVCWSAELGLFVAVSYAIGFEGSVMRSINGSDWLFEPINSTNSWISVAWSPELEIFTAVSFNGTGNRVMISVDGITWTNRESAADNTWRSVCWSPELGIFAAVSFGGTNNKVMTSTSIITTSSAPWIKKNDTITYYNDVIAGGNITASGYVTTASDIRLKKDIEPIINALSMVNNMRGVYYKLKSDITEKKNVGVIAQEIEMILPEVVKNGDYKSVAYGNIISVLIEAIKELSAEVALLKNK